MRRYLLAVILTISLVLASTCMPHAVLANEPASPALARWASTACPFKIPAGLKVRCGMFSVPEDRTNPASRMIQLAVAIVPARARPVAEPLLYLSGGPGSGALLSTATFATGWASFVTNRDFVLVDQRGTGFSKPSLACPEVDAADASILSKVVSRAEKVQTEVSAEIACHARLVRAGIDPSAYTSAASAADLDELRQTLGYRQWNVFGISYGTRLALTLLRDHPAGVRSAVLDSTYPLQVNLHTDMPANTDRVLNALFAGCAASEACSQAHPDLETTFYGLVHQLDAKPIMLNVVNPKTNKKVPIAVDGSEMIALVYRMLYITGEIPALPKMIADASRGDFGELMRMEGRRSSRMGNFSHGMYFSVQCSEEIAFATPESVATTAAAFPRLQRYFSGIVENTQKIFELCNAWGVRQPDPRENEPVQSTVPTLILAGAYDPITPPAWGELAASTITPSYVYTFANSGHAAISSSGCPARLIRAFLLNPSVAPDASCVAGVAGPQFR